MTTVRDHPTRTAYIEVDSEPVAGSPAAGRIGRVMNNRPFAMQPRAALLACATSALLGCASTPTTQTLEVLVQADDPAWSGPLPCKAANASGDWQFDAPGAVTVRTSVSPLRVACTLPGGASADPSVISARASSATREGAREGASIGAKIGGGAGAAVGIAAVPVMGPAFAVLLAVGSAFRGAEIGGLVGAVSSGPAWEYPSPIILRIKAAAPAAEAQPGRTR